MLADYVAETGQPAHPAVSAFCVYAAAWLKNAGVIGMGHSPTGFSLRLRDGSEILLADAPELYSTPSAAVSITGTSAGMSVNTPTRPTDISITGA